MRAVRSRSGSQPSRHAGQAQARGRLAPERPEQPRQAGQGEGYDQQGTDGPGLAEPKTDLMRPARRGQVARAPNAGREEGERHERPEAGDLPSRTGQAAGQRAGEQRDGQAIEKLRPEHRRRFDLAQVASYMKPGHDENQAAEHGQAHRATNHSP